MLGLYSTLCYPKRLIVYRQKRMEGLPLYWHDVDNFGYVLKQYRLVHGVRAQRQHY